MTEYIELRGARENNLKDVSLQIPKRQITIFTPCRATRSRMSMPSRTWAWR